jgi:tRNA pseudouridine13 synthase
LQRRGAKINPRMRRLFISAYQSELFNRYLEKRHADGLWRTALAGDVMKTARGGLFMVTPEELAQAQSRLASGEIVPTGPMFGSRMLAPPADSPAGELERALLENGVDFSDPLCPGTRRPLWVPLGDPSIDAVGPDILLRFILPPGSYATVVLEEVMKATH